MTPEEEAERNVRNLATAADGGSTALDDLTAAARRADATFAGSSLLFSRNLGDAVSSVSASLGKGVRFFETRFQTLRQLTDYGINFNYSMEAMETQINNARLTLSEFAGLVKEGNDRFVGLGISVSAGTTNFLNATASMLNATDEFGNRLENRIARLGYTTDETVEAFLNYQNQLKFSDMGRRRDEATLRRGFLEYTEVLDDLAKLTGKERDKIQETMTEAARDPVMMARDLSLRESVRGTGAELAGVVENRFGPVMASVVKDILGPGYLQGDNIYAAGFEFTRTLEQIRIAQDQGNRTLVDSLSEQLYAQMSELPTSAQFEALGVHERNAMGQWLRSAVRGMNEEGNASYLNYQRARQDLIREGNTAPTAIDIERRVQAELTRQRNLTSPPGPEEPRSGSEAYIAFIDSQISNERRNQTLRQEGLDAAYTNLSGVIIGLATTMGTLNSRLVQDIANVRATVQGLINGLGFSTTELQTQVQTAARTAASLGDEGFALSGSLQSLFDQYNSATNETDRQGILREMNDVLSAIAALQAQTMRIDATNAQINIDGSGMILNIPGAALPAAANGAGNNGSIGTLGAVGRIFKNYGTETMTALHGLEAVLTPDQLSDIVLRTVDSTLMAANNNLGQSGIDPSIRQVMRSFTTSLSSIDGRLNTIRSNFNDNRSLTNTNELGADAIGEIVALALGRMPSDMRDAFETALSNTIKNPIEQLVAVNIQNAETSSKIRRGITNMSTDYLRGA